MFVWKESFYFLVVLFLTIGLSALLPSVLSQTECTSDKDCQNSFCIASSCQCQKGFWGTRCEHCRFRLTNCHGIISDGKGKYAESAKCSWLVEPQRPNSTLLFSIEEFSTECSWDHLYIYDGKSIDAPLIAAISGLVKDKLTDEQDLTIEAKSGSAFLYFYSDVHYSLSGFNITYRTIDDCTRKCNGNGRCDQLGHCVCESGWAGPSCDQPACSATCEHGVCNPQTRKCNCYVGYTGRACSIPDGTPFWSSITANNQDEIFKRASHGAVVIGDYMWVVGGYSFNDFDRKNSFVARYNILTNTWEVINKTLSSTHPRDRYGHSSIAYNNTIIIYGGDEDNALVNELWSFDTNTFEWSQIQLSADSHQPLAVVGHTAVVVNSTMVVLFGYSREEYFSGIVQEFDLETRKWSRHSSPNCIRGSYGQSSVYHPSTGLIYVHGGFKQGSRFYSFELSSDLLAYDPHKRFWYTLKSSGYPRFLHSAANIGNQMFVFGGNTHNDSGKTQPKARCYSAGFLTYDMGNNVWRKVTVSKSPPNLARYGHSAVTFNSTMYVFGGFSGVMFNDILTFTVGNCSKFKNESSCLIARNSSGCVWDQAASSCFYHQYGNFSFKKETLQCGTQMPCLQENGCKFLSCNYTECDTCLVDRDCMWCESQQRCHPIPTYVVTFPYGQCRAWTDKNLGCSSTKCGDMKTCEDCHTLPGCGWCDDGSGTGLGQCLEGGDDGVKVRTSINRSLVYCPKERWNFVGCPPCRCNGHSLCTNVSVCEDCQHNTRGSHCEYCRSGYYGNAKYGGRCRRCYCNGHGDKCHHRTGRCDCVEAAVTGDECEMCKRFYKVNDHSYLLVEGNATRGNHCYILVHPCFDCAAVKFNVTEKSRICIQTTPYKDRDLQFAIEVLSKNFAYLNFSIVSDVKSERVLESDLRIGSYKHVLSHESYNFDGGVKIRACVYDIQSPLAFAILFYQPTPILNLLVFFVTFFGCFFSLLLVAGFVWKIRSRWVRHLSYRRRLEEQAQRASRPFTKVIIELSTTEDWPTRSPADAIAWEPCADGKTAVTTVLMRLPATKNGIAPIGESGLTCASALITLDHPSSRRKEKPLSKQRQTTCF